MKLLRYISKKGQQEHGMRVGKSIYHLKDITTTEALECLEEEIDFFEQVQLEILFNC